MVDKYAKAIVAFIVTAYGMYAAARGADTPGGAGVTTDEWINTVMTVLITTAAVWGIPNKVDDMSADVTKYTTVSTSHPVESIQMVTKSEDENVSGATHS
jgi:hypothetical protein